MIRHAGRSSGRTARRRWGLHCRAQPCAPDAGDRAVFVGPESVGLHEDEPYYFLFAQGLEKVREPLKQIALWRALLNTQKRSM